MSEYWFKPHRYGIGASPSSWEGWAVTLLYVAGVVAMAVWMGDRGGPNNIPAVLAYVVGFTAATIALVFIAWKRTYGEWRWRWGDED